MVTTTGLVPGVLVAVDRSAAVGRFGHPQVTTSETGSPGAGCPPGRIVAEIWFVSGGSPTGSWTSTWQC